MRGRPPMAGEPAGAQPQILAMLDDEGPGEDGLQHALAGAGAQPAVVAHAVSTAVLARLDRPRRLRVVGAGRGALHLDLDGFVVTIGDPPGADDAERDRRRRGEAPRSVAWDPARPRPGTRCAAPGLARRVRALATGWPPGWPSPTSPRRRRRAAAGRGPGLTPEGDDVLAGAAAAVRALAPPPGSRRRADAPRGGAGPGGRAGAHGRALGHPARPRGRRGRARAGPPPAGGRPGGRARAAPSPTSGGWARPRGARWRRGSPSRPGT